MENKQQNNFKGNFGSRSQSAAAYPDLIRESGLILISKTHNQNLKDICHPSKEYMVSLIFGEQLAFNSALKQHCRTASILPLLALAALAPEANTSNLRWPQQLSSCEEKAAEIMINLYVAPGKHSGSVVPWRNRKGLHVHFSRSPLKKHQETQQGSSMLRGCYLSICPSNAWRFHNVLRSWGHHGHGPRHLYHHFVATSLKVCCRDMLLIT